MNVCLRVENVERIRRKMSACMRCFFAVVFVFTVFFSRPSDAQATGIGFLDTLRDIYDSVTSPKITGSFRVEARLTRLQNVNGRLADGSSCDPVGKCDPIVHAFVDYETPTADFGAPASADFQFYTHLFTVREDNSPVIDKIIKRDICGQTFKRINVRVHIIDHDRIGKNDLIGNFRCFVNTKDQFAQNMELAEWSAEAPCENAAGKNDITLLWKHRIFRVDEEDCGALTTPFSATAAPG